MKFKIGDKVRMTKRAQKENEGRKSFQNVGVLEVISIGAGSLVTVRSIEKSRAPKLLVSVQELRPASPVKRA
jgi:hypothetical protein